MKDRNFKISTFIIIAFLNSITLSSQDTINITTDFSAFQSHSDFGVAVEEIDGDNAIRLSEDSASFSIASDNIKRIDFRHSIPKYNDDFVFYVDAVKHYESGTTDTINLVSEKIAGETKSVEVVFNSIFRDISHVGNTEVIFYILQNNESGDGYLYVNNIVVHKLSDPQISKIEKDRDDQNKLQIIGTKIGKSGQEICEDISVQYNNRKSQFVEDFQFLIRSYERIETVKLIGLLSDYNSSRSQMGNPIAYPEFKNIIDSIKVDANAITSKVLEEYQVKLDTLLSNTKQIVGTNPKEEGGVGAVFSALTKVANIVTGGQVDNVLNSIKGLIGVVFNKPALEDKYPIKEFYDQTIGKGKGAVEVKVVRFNDKNRQKINAILNKGLTYVDSLNVFIDLVEDENNSYLDELYAITEIGRMADELLIENDLLITEHIRIIGYDVNIDQIRVAGNADRPTMENKLVREFEQKYDVAVPKCDDVSGINPYYSDFDKLQNISQSMKNVKNFERRNNELNERLRSTFLSQQSVLMQKENPFDPTLQRNSFRQYNLYRDSALKAIEEIIKLLRINEEQLASAT